MRKRVKPFAFIMEANGASTFSNDREAKLHAARKKYDILCEQYKYGKTSEEDELQIVSLRETFGFPAPPRRGKKITILGIVKFYTYEEYVNYYLKAFGELRK